MKTLFSLIFLISQLIHYALAQNVGTKKTINPNNIVWDALIVKDADSTYYPTAIWQKLAATGKYALKLSSDNKTALLVLVPASEREKRMATLPKPSESKFFKTGEKFTGFSEKDMEGNKYSIKQLAGKVVVLNFWFINCPPCRQEIPQLNELVNSYADNKDVVFIAIALDPKYELEQFLKLNPYQYHIIDNGRYLAAQYGVSLYPTHVVVDKMGKVLFHTSGLATNTVYWINKSIDLALNASLPKQ